MECACRASSIGTIFTSVVELFRQLLHSFVLLTTQRAGDGLNVFPWSLYQLMHVSDSLSQSDGTYPSHKHLFHIISIWFRQCASVTLHEQELGSSKHTCLLSPSERTGGNGRNEIWWVGSKKGLFESLRLSLCLQREEQCAFVHVSKGQLMH